MLLSPRPPRPPPALQLVRPLLTALRRRRPTPWSEPLACPLLPLLPPPPRLPAVVAAPAGCWAMGASCPGVFGSF